jgi:hypothetical protein
MKAKEKVEGKIEVRGRLIIKKTLKLPEPGISITDSGGMNTNTAVRVDTTKGNERDIKSTRSKGKE